MKRIKIETIIMFIILLMPLTIKAETVTKETLTEAYKLVLACQKEGNYTVQEFTAEDGSKTTINVCNDQLDFTGIDMDQYITNDTIYVDAEGGSKIAINYAIQDNGDVLFYTSHTIDNTTTYEQYESYVSDPTNIIIGYPIVARVKDVEYADSSVYIGNILMNYLFGELETTLSGISNTSYVIVDDDVDYTGEATAIKKSEFPSHAVEYAKATLGTSPTGYNDKDSQDTFEVTITPDVSDNTKYVLTTKMLVKSSKDFSSIQGALNNYIDGSASKNSLDSTEEPTGDNEPTAYNPKTGAFLNAIPVIVLLSVGFILLLNSKNYFKKI